MPLVVSSNQGILNPGSGSKTTDTFRHFNRLPPEVRQIIWEIELKHERLLHVEAHFLETPPDDPGVESTDCLGRAYEIILTEFRPISKLARVNSESRIVASRFYRVQLPCVYRWKGKEDTDGIFYFNPELDTLEIRGKAFFNFAEDLWVHDARHIGLVNIAMTWEHSIVKSKVNASLLPQVLSRLKRVVFLYRGGIERMFLGEPRTSNYMDKAEVYRSRPIMPATPKFDRLPCDPRSQINASLKKIYLDYFEPRKLIHGWLRLMTKWKVLHNHEVDYRFLVAFGGRRYHPYDMKNKFGVDRGWRGRVWKPKGYEHNPEITNRDAAIRWVQRKDEAWREIVRDMREEEEEEGEEEEAGRGEGEVEEEEESAEGSIQELELPLRPAVGFWLFPIEALGPLPDITKKLPRRGAPVPGWEPHRKIDLSGYRLREGKTEHVKCLGLKK